MPDPEHAHSIIFQRDQDPVVAVAKAEPASHIAVRCGQVAAPVLA
jgi:hypothetical protein